MKNCKDRSKFNVEKDREKRTFDGIVFDSRMEMKFYCDVICPGVESGGIRYFELQKPYELQPRFTYNNKNVLPVTYVADFYVEYNNGCVEVIDVKGCPDSVALLKRKLFWYRYPDIKYSWVTYSKKWGGWVDYDVVKKLRKEEKRR